MADINLYGIPLQPLYPQHLALSSLNSSFDVISLGGGANSNGNNNKKRKSGHKEFKSH